MLTCERCGVINDTVEEIEDPYDKEINEVETIITVCSECYEDLLGEI